MYCYLQMPFLSHTQYETICPLVKNCKSTALNFCKYVRVNAYPAMARVTRVLAPYTFLLQSALLSNLMGQPTEWYQAQGVAIGAGAFVLSLYSLSYLHTAVPTSSFNGSWHSQPYIPSHIYYTCIYCTDLVHYSSISVPHITSQSTGWSALFFAVRYGHLEITRLLIDAGANVLLKDYVMLHVLRNTTQFCKQF